MIIVGDLDLYCFFDTFKLGKIVSVRIMTDKENGRSKGFGKLFSSNDLGFVSFDNSHAANMAIKVINGKQALGKRLKVELKKGGPPHQSLSDNHKGGRSRSYSNSVTSGKPQQR